MDKQHFIILRDEWQGPEGAPLRRTVARSVAFLPNLDDSLFAIPANWRVVNAAYHSLANLSLEEAQRWTGFPVQVPQFVPAGYQLASAAITYCQNGVPILHLQYTDGMNTLSVFEHPAPCRPLRGFRFRRGWQGPLACEGIPRTELAVSKVVGGLRIVVLGHPSQAVMERIVESLQPLDDR